MNFIQTANGHDLACGKHLKIWRTAHDMTLFELAEASGRSYQQVQKYEAGRNRMSVGVYLAYAELFSASAMFLPRFPQADMEKLRLIARLDQLCSRFGTGPVEAALDALLRLD